MKVLQVINSLTSGGAEKLVLDTVPLYNAQGGKVDVLLLWDNDLVFAQKLKKQNCCEVHILKKSANYKHIYSPMHIFKMVKIIKQYDLVHVHLFPAQYYTVLANILIGNKCKLLMTEHNVTNNRINVPAFKPLERFIYNKYARIICISEEIKTIYANYLKPLAPRLVIIENGVSIKTIQKAIPYAKEDIIQGISKEDTVLLQVSAFRKQKDQPTLIKALTHLPQHVKLLLVGEGMYLQNCKDMAKQLQLEHRVFFLGMRTDVARLLNSVDIVVLSSHNEGMSLSSIEGMASGKPFVASDVPGLSNIVQGAGVLFKCGDAQGLAVAIQRLLEDQHYYNETVKTCLARAAQYDIQVMVDKTKTLYKEVHAVSK
jgi:glycosyltransferase involved in cell wall biosynthesis